MSNLRGTIFYMKTNILQDFCSALLTGVEGGAETLLVFDTSV